MNAFFILNSGDDSILKSFGFHRTFFLTLCILFIFQEKPVWAQPWQQLGPGAGGQERALYLHENIAGNYVLYVGSDVSGVWRSRTINPNQRDDPNQYYYDYISNHRIFRFVNKFYRPSTYDSPYLFALNRSGVDRINLFNESEEMKRVSLNYQGVNFDKSWVSDIYIGQPLSNGELFNSVGMLQLKKPLNTDMTSMRFSTEHLAPGVYHYRIDSNGDFHLNGKLVIIR